VDGNVDNERGRPARERRPTPSHQDWKGQSQWPDLFTCLRPSISRTLGQSVWTALHGQRCSTMGADCICARRLARTTASTAPGSIGTRLAAKTASSLWAPIQTSHLPRRVKRPSSSARPVATGSIQSPYGGRKSASTRRPMKRRKPLLPSPLLALRRSRRARRIHHRARKGLV
jgi:hypothetical protein